MLFTGRSARAQDELYYELYEELYEEIQDELYEDKAVYKRKERPYDYKLWERKGKYQRKINEIGFRLLNANRFARRVNFRLINVKLYNMESYNAFARYSDGRIAVYSGYLYYFDNDDELAAILAHELAHIQQLSTGPWLWKRIKMHFAPQYYEYNADLKGIDYMVKAGYNPIAMLTFLNKICHEKSAYYKFKLFIRELGFMFLLPFNTHPTGSKRLLNVYNHIKTHYPRFLADEEENLYYINFFLNSEKNQDIKEIKNRYDITVPGGYEDL